MIRVAIVGAGVSGLTTAFYLEQERRKGAPLEISVFEAEPRYGGVIRTERVEGCLIEAGPDSFLTSKPWARELCEDLRLSSQLIGSRDSERKIYILVSGRLEPIPPGMQMMVPTQLAPVLRSHLFSWRTKLKMLGEYLSPPEPLAADDDESVAGFVQRHFNSEVVDRLADPLLSGIYGGGASRLSARATLPQLLESEARHRSLDRAALIARAKPGSPPAAPLFTSLRDGMQRMLDALVRQLPLETIRLSQKIDRLQPIESGWRITSGESAEDFDHVVLAVPAAASAKLMSAIPGS